jgi:hypothetical protein
MTMKCYLILMLLLLTLPVFAQTGDIGTPPAPAVTEEPVVEAFIGGAEVQVESAYVRALPLRESEAVSSLFENDRVDVVGRNIDGLWLLVRRPNRRFNLGWVAAELLDYDFGVESLPMMDAETGLIGDTPIDPNNIPVRVVAESNLRVEPILTADIVGVIPLGAVVPATGRDTDGLWLFVNFRGTTGWINSVNYRRPAGMMQLPDLTFIADPNVPRLSALVIPPDIQLSQVEAMRGYAQASAEVANMLAPFWENVANGEVMPCQPPDFVQQYLVDHQDVRELPELNRFVPRYNQGVTLLNQSIDPLYICGVLMLDVILEARNDAINAVIIMQDTVVRLNEVEDIIRFNNNLDPRVTPTTAP